MFNNVIVGIDDDEGGRDAIALAKLLAAGGGRLTLAQVYPGDSAVSRRSSPDYEAAQHERIRALLEARRAEAGVDAELRWYGSPSVGRGLHELAEPAGADLLVIGSSRRGLLGRVLIGDDTRAALNGAPCAVAIAPAGYRREPAAMRRSVSATTAHPRARRRSRSRGSWRLSMTPGFRRSRRSPPPACLYLGHLTTAAPVELASIHDEVDEARERIAALGGVEPHAAYGGPGRGADPLQRFSRSARHRLEGLRTARQAGLWWGRAAARPHHALPAARSHAVGADRSRRHARRRRSQQRRLGELIVVSCERDQVTV